MTTQPTVAVAGCGYWGKNPVRNFSQLGALAVVCDPQEAGRELAAEALASKTEPDALDGIV